MGIKLSDILNKDSITFVINEKTKETREIILQSPEARKTLKYILAAFFDVNKISKKDGIIDEKEQIAFFKKAQKYLIPCGDKKRVLTRSAMLKLKNELFGKKNPAPKNTSGLRYTFKQNKAGQPAYCMYEINGDKRWYIINIAGKKEFIHEDDIEDTRAASFEEIWQKRRPKGFNIADWSPEGDYGVIETTGCGPITLNTQVEGGRTVIKSPCCETRPLSTSGTSVFRYSNQACVLKFLTAEHAKRFFEVLLYRINELQKHYETKTQKRPNPRDVSKFWDFYNELLYRRLYLCKRNNGKMPDSLAIDIGSIVPTPKIEKNRFGEKTITNIWEVDLGWEFNRTLSETYWEVLQEAKGKNYDFAGGTLESVKDKGPQEQKRYIDFCTKGMDDGKKVDFRSRMIAENVRKHDDGFWGNAWGSATLWMEGWDNIYQTGYHLADVRNAAYAVSPPKGKPGTKENKDYKLFWKIYGKQIARGELLVFELPTIPSNWATNFFIPQTTYIGNYVTPDIPNKATSYSNLAGAGSGIVLLVKNTPETRKIYEKAANKAWNVNTCNAFFNADTWREFNVPQKRSDMFDKGAVELLDKADDYLKGTKDLENVDIFDEDEVADKSKDEKKTELVLILHALYGLVMGFRVMTDFGINYISRAHFIANLVNFPSGIYDIIKLFRHAQKPEDMLDIMFMLVGILSHGKKFGYKNETGLEVEQVGCSAFGNGLKVTMDLENNVAIIKNNRGVVQKVTGEAFERLRAYGVKALAYKKNLFGDIRKRYERTRKELHPQDPHKKGGPIRGKKS